VGCRDPERGVSDPSPVKNEASYLTQQQPGLFEPNADLVVAWKSSISGTPASFANLTQYWTSPEYWDFVK